MHRWTATVPPGLEPVVLRELALAGIEGRIEPGAVVFGAQLERGAPLASSLRTPTRLLLHITRGKWGSLGELAALVRRADWASVLDPRAPLEVSVAGSGGPRIRKDMVQKKVQHAIKDVLRGTPRKGPGRGFYTQRVQVRMSREGSMISIDAGGELLHRRGWRQEQGRASLRENFAAALILMGGWDQQEALVDPFCGAGTIPIEAALMAAKRPPGHPRRAYAWTEWPALRAQAKRTSRAKPAVPPGIVLGADKESQALAMAASNAERAAVRPAWRLCNVAELEAPAPTGLIVTNPPYGQRLGQHVEGVYRALGQQLAGPFRGWRALFLCPHASLAQRVHSGAERLTSFSNGGLRVGVWAVG